MSSPRDTLDKWLAPGVWLDVEGNVHFSVPDFLDLFGLEDTEANRAAVIHFISKISLAARPDAPVIYRDKPDP